jgi:tetratricopeptide (TPR) repeat protein
MVIMGGIFFYFTYRYNFPGKKIFIKIIIIFLVIIIGLSGILLHSETRKAIIDKIKTAFNPQYRTNVVRLNIWRSTLQMIKKENTLFGIGLDYFKYSYPAYRDKEEYRISGSGSRVRYAHNEYLQITAELGIIGLIIFTFIIWRVFITIREILCKKNTDREIFLIALGLTGSVISILIHSISSFPIRNPASGYTFFIFLGMLFLINKKPEQESKKIPKPFIFFIFILCIFGFLVYLFQFRSELYLYKSRFSFSRKKFRQALKYSNETSSVFVIPDDNLIQQASCNISLGNYEKAEKTLLKIIKSNPYYIGAMNNLANLYRRYVKLEKYRKEKDYYYGKAEYYYSKVLRTNPYHTEAINNIGNLYQDKGELDTALNYYLRAIGIKPGNAAPYCNMGNVYFRKAELIKKKVSLSEKKDFYKKAEESYKEAIKLNPKYAQAYSNLGGLYYRQKKIKLAENFLKKGIEKNPGYPPAYYHLGILYHTTGKYKKAIDAFHELLTLNRGYINAYHNLGMCYEAIGEYKKAIRIWKAGLKIDPNYQPLRENIELLKKKFD